MKLLKRAVCAVSALAFGALATVGHANAQDVTLRYSPWFAPDHFLHVDIMKPWIEEIERVTEGRVTIEFLPKVVGTVATQLAVAEDGLADVVLIVEGYTPGRFIGPEMAELPALSDKVSVLAPVYDRMFRKYIEPLGEYEGVHVLTTIPTVNGQIFTRNRIIEQLDDAQGLKLRTPNAVSVEISHTLGIVPVQKPASEAYELLSTGIIDGTFGTIENIVLANKLGDSVPYLTIVPGGLYRAVISFLVNEDAWNRISEADQAAIMSVSGDTIARRIGEAYDRIDQQALEQYRQDGHTAVEMDLQTVEALNARLAPIEGAWIERVKARGLADPAAVLAEFRAELAAEEARQSGN